MLSVLLVDDSMIFREILAEVLEKAGHRVLGEAGSGEEAILKHAQLDPDVTILDITMPGMDGIETLTKILANKSGAKVIMVSSAAQQDNVTEALIIGAYDFLRKPLDSEKLIDLMADIAESLGK